jgi:putative addiction module killer protein
MLPCLMPDVRVYETLEGRRPFDDWFDSLEARAAARVTKVLSKIRSGLLPSVEPIGGGVHESKIDYGPGYRVYFGVHNGLLIFLLGGGDKRSQKKDIAEAKQRWADYKTRKPKGRH